MDHFPKLRGEYKEYLNPPPRYSFSKDVVFMERGFRWKIRSWQHGRLILFGAFRIHREQ